MSEQILEQLIKKVSKLPGLGPRSSRRAVLHLLKNKDKYLLPLINDLTEVAHNIRTCSECGNFDQDEICGICKNSSRNSNLICIVETVADLWALERTKVYNGKYHILGGVLSAIDGINPEQLNITSLEKRLQKHGYFTQKGKFGYVKRSPLKSKKVHRTRKGDIRKTARRAYMTKSGKKLW